MREIKFRGMTSKGWLYGDLIHNRGKVYIAPVGEIYHESVPEDFEVDENSIGQFTGLCDKNNKEIYEGDKLKYSFELFKEFLQGSVIFNRGSFDFLGYPLCSFQTNQFEIIGNIYDKNKVFNPCLDEYGFDIDDKGFNNEARYWMSIPNLPDVNKK